MKRIVAGLCFSLIFSLSIFSQNTAQGLKTVELSSEDPGKSCFSFVAESLSCGKVSDLYFGVAPRSAKWKWFRASGDGTRNRIRSLGKKAWADDFEVPVVKPYPALARGIQRDPFLNASMQRPSLIVSAGTPNNGGADVLSGRRDAERSKTMAKLPELKPAQNSNNYYPFEKVVLGNMYVMRIVDENNDFYVLFRVDELEEGKRVKISWRRIEAPQGD